MKGKTNFSLIIHKIENWTAVRSIRNGLVHIIPIIIIGAFSLILQTFPITAYQNAIKTFLNGYFLEFLSVVNKATLGVLSVYMTYSISRAYMRIKAESGMVTGGAVLASLVSFFILAGAYLSDFKIDYLGPKSMFLAIITGLGASWLYRRLYIFGQQRKKAQFLVGDNRDFNKMISTLFPIAVVVLTFALANTVVTGIFHVGCFRELIIKAFNKLFSYIGSGFGKGFFFVFLSSILWFFGIHGSDTLENVMQTYFTPNLAANQAAVASGGAASNILTKQFFDCFVLMGGCGATICLLITILIFSKNRSRKTLGLTAAFPMIFNINELMVFGLPIIFNPIMLIPFLAVPLVCYSISYGAIASGLVPMITHEVEWTTPILLGGYTATGSIAGSILQLVNVVVGVLIYLPFVRILDKRSAESAKNNFETFMKFYKENEQDLATVKITELGNIYGDYAKDLCNDIRYGLSKNVVLAYQPQYNYEGNCIGAEALLRYEHPIIGLLYPPLVIKLAEEGEFLAELEEKVLAKAIEDRPKVLEKFGEGIKISVNVTGLTVVTERYINYCRSLNEKDSFAGKNMCIEVTEQAAVSFDDHTLSALRALHDMGLLLAIDDFSMGQTSIHYLKDNMFDIIKLDGSIVGGVCTNDATRDIISSIVQLADSLNLMVLAEYVDSEEKKEALHNIGCDNYQGWLYSPAVFLDSKE